ncbi:MAG: hypothetical protein WCI73_03945, partial [Phycisphaerae bacterium]
MSDDVGPDKQASAAGGYVFSPLAVAGASALGSPLAGCGLLAVNAWRGVDTDTPSPATNRRRAYRLIAAGILGALCYLALLKFCPTWSVRILVILAQTLIVYITAAIVTPHVGDDPDDLTDLRSPPLWQSAAAGGAGLVLLLILSIGWQFSSSVLPGGTGWRRELIAPRAEVLYHAANLATPAHDLGTALQQSGYLSPVTGRLALLTDDQSHRGGKVVWLIGGESKNHTDYHDLQATVRQAIGRGPISIHVLDDQFIPVANFDLP